MRRLITGALAVAATAAALTYTTPAAEAGTELRQPSCSHEWVESTVVKWYVDPGKLPDEKVLKVWVADHRARRLARDSWVHAHVAQSDYWISVEILTTRARWSGWLYCGTEA